MTGTVYHRYSIPSLLPVAISFQALPSSDSGYKIHAKTRAEFTCTCLDPIDSLIFGQKLEASMMKQYESLGETVETLVITMSLSRSFLERKTVPSQLSTTCF